MEIKILARQGHGIKEIAREPGLSRNTVRKYMRSNEREDGACNRACYAMFNAVIAALLSGSAKASIPGINCRSRDNQQHPSQSSI